MQPTTVGTTILSDEIKYVDAIVDYALSTNMTVYIDIHNFCRYAGIIIGSNSTNMTGYTTVD